MFVKRILALTFMMFLAAIAASAQPPGTAKKTTIQGPDLITDGIREMDLNNGKPKWRFTILAPSLRSNRWFDLR